MLGLYLITHEYYDSHGNYDDDLCQQRQYC